MLSSIHIENVALITSLDIDFDGGFSVFTGETGAGKSIIIDAIGFVMGNRSERDIIRTGEVCAAVEALFSGLSEKTREKCASLGIEPDEEGCLFIRRTLSADGRGSVKINGRNVPVSLLRELSAYLVNIHGQHHNGELLRSEKHLSILDAFGECEAELADYRTAYKQYAELVSRKRSLSVNDKEKKRRIDVLKFQIDEIKKAKIRTGEEEQLLREREKLKNIEKLSKGIGEAYALLYGDGGSAAELVGSAASAIRPIADIIPDGEALAERLSDFKYQIADIAELLHENIEGFDGDPDAALDRIETRLDVLSRLKMKYGASEAEILGFLAGCEKELSETEDSDALLSEVEDSIRKLIPTLREKALALRRKRTKAGERLSELVMNELKYLDMKGTGFSVSLRSVECGMDGADSAEFLVSTNVGEPAKPLVRTASGGELARIMLAIKCVLAEKDSVETMIFDEVDTGVSGKTSRKIGLKLLEIAKDREVLCVTHSAQIASLGDHHFKVEKTETEGRTVTGARQIEGDERTCEVARIISGIGVTESAKTAARELMKPENRNV